MLINFIIVFNFLQMQSLNILKTQDELSLHDFYFSLTDMASEIKMKWHLWKD